MSEAAAVSGPATETFDALDHALTSSGPAAALDLLVSRLDERGEFRALLDALLLKARHELGLPLIQVGSLSQLPEAQRLKYEDRYVEAIRTVGGKLLAAGDIAAAWPYFRAIGENEPITRAIDAYSPGEEDERLGQVVEVAFNQGAHPRRGFELILDHYGTCSAISAFEHLPRDESIRVACADKLVRQVHTHLASNIRAEIAQRGQPVDSDQAPIESMIEGRAWLFQDDAYHIDVSHLAATVRTSPLLNDPATIALALDLTEYGRQLSGRHRYEGDPPFEDVYGDHNVYLKAILGRDVDLAIAHFRAKLGPSSVDTSESSQVDPAPAQVLVAMLVRLGRLDEAIDVAAEHFAGIPDSALFCPGYSQLCQRAGQPERLAKIARDQGDVVNYVAAILQSSERSN